MGFSALKNRYYHPKFNLLGFKEYENNVNQYRVENGLTLGDLEKLTGIRVTRLWTIAEGYAAPFYESEKKKGVFKAKPWAIKLADIFKCDVIEIFPREACFLIEKKDLTSEQISSLAHSEIKQTHEIIEAYSLRVIILDLLKTLTHKEEVVVLCFYGFGKEYTKMDLAQIGREIGVSKERVRQILARALRKLRHPSRSNKIKEFFNG